MSGHEVRELGFQRSERPNVGFLKIAVTACNNITYSIAKLMFATGLLPKASENCRVAVAELSAELHRLLRHKWSHTSGTRVEGRATQLRGQNALTLASVIRWKQPCDRAPVAVFDEPKGLGLVGVFKDLKVVQAAVTAR